MKAKSITHSVVGTGLMSALLIVSQVTLSFIPNVELVSFLVIMYSLHRPAQARVAIGVFVILEGLLFGFSLWWAAYIYIWYILHILTLFVKKQSSAFSCAVVSALFGLLFGTLCSIVTFFVAGIGGGIAFIISGIPFDIVHCIANFVIMIVLYKPVNSFFLRLPEGKF